MSVLPPVTRRQASRVRIARAGGLRAARGVVLEPFGTAEPHHRRRGSLYF